MFNRKALEKLTSELKIVNYDRDLLAVELGQQKIMLADALKKLVTEIEARHDAEDANEILASLLCMIVKEKRSKKGE